MIMIDTIPITPEFAEERIARAIETIPDPKAKVGLARLDARLAQQRVSPAMRLHSIAAVKQLGLESAATLSERLRRAGQRPK